MPDPFSFTSASPRFGFPFLFSGQSQKEFFVNQAHALADALLHPVIEGTADSPPAAAQEGQCWIVGPAPTGPWQGHAGNIAAFEAGTWIFATPRDGVRVFDRSAGREARYLGGWHRANRPAAPVGGTTVDTEARAAIVQLIAALATAGLIAEN